jgi:hypothetical protein
MGHTCDWWPACTWRLSTYAEARTFHQARVLGGFNMGYTLYLPQDRLSTNLNYALRL